MGIKWQGCKANDSTVSSTKVKNCGTILHSLTYLLGLMLDKLSPGMSITF
jgi:hypothetical protein